MDQVKIKEIEAELRDNANLDDEEDQAILARITDEELAVCVEPMVGKWFWEVFDSTCSSVTTARRFVVSISG